MFPYLNLKNSFLMVTFVICNVDEPVTTFEKKFCLDDKRETGAG